MTGEHLSPSTAPTVLSGTLNLSSSVCGGDVSTFRFYRFTVHKPAHKPYQKTGKIAMYPKSQEPRLGPRHAADSSILHAVTARHPQGVTRVPTWGNNGSQRASSRISEAFRAQRSSGTLRRQLQEGSHVLLNVHLNAHHLGPQTDLRERLGCKHPLSA